MKHLLTIAGSDSCGGAGIQADIKTFSALGCYAMSVITAVTAQNTQGVRDVCNLPVNIVEGQIDAIFQDIRVDAVKVGMVSQTAIIEAIAEKLAFYKPEIIVVDPVMVSKSGCNLLEPEATDALIQKLLPLATLITPNIPEAEVITGCVLKEAGEREAALLQMHRMGAKNVLLKGGHLEGDAEDLLFDGDVVTRFSAKRILTKNTHGTGCTLSSAIAANLANGCSVPDAVRRAKEYITTAIAHAIPLGKGVGPTNHFYHLYQQAGLTKES